MATLHNLAGLRFGSLVVSHRVPKEETTDRRTVWECLCDCGGSKVACSQHLTKGHTTHCGCELPSSVLPEHPNPRKSPEYRTWVAMRQRCTNPNNKNYNLYGERGIKVCRRWWSFKSFIADMGRRPEGHTLDRIDGNGGYNKNNCRWATPTTQNNNSSNCRFIEHKGEVLTLTKWAIKLGISTPTLHERLRKWTKERALTTPRK